MLLDEQVAPHRLETARNIGYTAIRYRTDNVQTRKLRLVNYRVRILGIMITGQHL